MPLPKLVVARVEEREHFVEVEDDVAAHEHPCLEFVHFVSEVAVETFFRDDVNCLADPLRQVLAKMLERFECIDAHPLDWLAEGYDKLLIAELSQKSELFGLLGCLWSVELDELLVYALLAYQLGSYRAAEVELLFGAGWLSKKVHSHRCLDVTFFIFLFSNFEDILLFKCSLVKLFTGREFSFDLHFW